MPTTLTLNTPAPLDERVQDHREALTVLMADADRCEDISSGINIPSTDHGLGDVLSDYRLKCDIAPVAWSR